MAKKICPNCKGSNFKARIIYGGIVNANDDGSYEVVMQGNTFAVQPCECTGCGAKFESEKDLAELAICKTCGKQVIDVDENGDCVMCRINKTRPDIAGLTMEQLYLKLLSTEAQLKAGNNEVNKTEVQKENLTTAQQKVAAAKQAVAQAQTTTTAEESKEEQEQASEETKTTKRRKPKDKSDDKETVTEAAAPVEVPVPEAVADNADFMNAPQEETKTEEQPVEDTGSLFPDFSPMNNPDFMNGIDNNAPIF